jgi:hypothetical protein
VTRGDYVLTLLLLGGSWTFGVGAWVFPLSVLPWLAVGAFLPYTVGVAVRLAYEMSDGRATASDSRAERRTSR